MEVRNYIDGRFQQAINGEKLINIDPAKGISSGELPDSDKDDVDLAVEAAKKGAETWSAMRTHQRSELLRDIAHRIDLNLEELAVLESEDNGKPVRLARKMDIPRASANLRFYAGAAEHYASAAHPSGHMLNYTLRSPLGIVGCISPWNLPLYLFTWKIAPALAAGNAVIAKPSELAPVTAFRFSEHCAEAGLPAGVLNVLHGRGATVGEAIVTHPSIPAISFTGGTRTGQRIAGLAAQTFKKLSLEMGGKNAAVIFADCDLETTVSETVKASFTNQGEICLCSSRILVEASVYDDYVNRFCEKAATLEVGDPRNEETRIGALISQEHLAKIRNYIELSLAEGGTIQTGGQQVFPEGRCAGGYFFQPTVITGLPMECRVNQEEIFGPVVTIMPFHTEEEALALANRSVYGLSATVWTNDLSRAHRVSAGIHAGVVWVNCWLMRDLRTPFGGWKNSGMGREGGWDALDFFTESKNICIHLP